MAENPIFSLPRTAFLITYRSVRKADCSPLDLKQESFFRRLRERDEQRYLQVFSNHAFGFMAGGNGNFRATAKASWMGPPPG